MKHFTIRIILYLTIIFFIFLGAEFYVSRQLLEGKRYYFQADWHDLGGHNSDVVFIGNSRTWTQIDPTQIMDSLGIDCEIIAQDGQTIGFLWLKFKEYLKVNPKPSDVYIQFDPWFIFDREDLYGIDNIRTCFFGDRVDLTQLKDREGYIGLYRFLPTAALDHELMLKIFLKDTISFDSSFEKTRGFISNDVPWSGNWDSIAVRNYDWSTRSSYIDSFMNLFATEKIKVHGYIPPVTNPLREKILNLDTLNTIFFNHVYAHGIREANFTDFSNFKVYNDSSLFYNHMHLNRKGVSVFMNQILSDDDFL